MSSSPTFKRNTCMSKILFSLCKKTANGLERILCRALVQEDSGRMDRCTGCCDITEILVKAASNSIQSINQSINQSIYQSFSS